MRLTHGWRLIFTFLLGTGEPATAQLSLDISRSTWSGAGSFYGGPDGIYATANYANVDNAHGIASTGTDVYILGFDGGPPRGLTNYHFKTGTSLHLFFIGLTAVPKYVAYTGGTLTGYTFSPGANLAGGTGSISMNVSTINPVASASDPTGLLLNHNFGVRIATGGTVDFGGAVIRTDMYWVDISDINLGYPGTRPTMGLNASGQPDVLATFEAYLPFTFLQSIGISKPSDAEALVQKADGTTINLSLTNSLFTVNGLDPGLPGGGYFLGGTTTFDFNGGGSDGYMLATYANSRWSSGNIGLKAVPEPSTFILLLCSLALLGATRRRVNNNGSMRQDPGRRGVRGPSTHTG